MSKRISEHDAAYCAAAWASGEKLRSLAATFGYNTRGVISSAISGFLSEYSGNGRIGPHVIGNERKALVPAALARFRSGARGASVIYRERILQEARERILPIADV